MPQPAKLLKKAELREIKWVGKKQKKAVLLDKRVPVQFNPQTLKVTFSNQVSGGDQSGGSSIQYVGSGTTRLSMELWFDVTVPDEKGKLPKGGDVRVLTKDVNYFMKVDKKKKKGKNKFIPPGVRFIWGTFLFDGIMNSMDETLEFFSEDGKPQRARVSISLTSQEIQFQQAPPPPAGGKADAAGTQPQKQARTGDTLQNMAARDGKSEDWKIIAAANNIENPRRLKPGTLLKLDVPVD
jgi:hypothetical protein